MSPSMENRSTPVTPSHAEIAALAETIFVKSGRIPGRDVENWLAAEAQLKQQQDKRKAETTESKPEQQKNELKTKRLNRSQPGRSQLVSTR
jgi:hypothetical protein